MAKQPTFGDLEGTVSEIDRVMETPTDAEREHAARVKREMATVPTPGVPVAEIRPVTIDALLAAAIVEGRSADEVQQLHELIRTRKADLNREAFNRAFVQFKRDCPPIPRTRKTKQYQRVTDDGRTVDGSYADLEGIEKVVGPVLLECGLSYRWIDTKVDEGHMVVVCRLSHIDGHFEDSPSPPFPLGQATRGQSPPQASASVSTFACRYSLKNSLGLTTVDEDDDGRGQPVETITEAQQHTLNDLLIAAEDGEQCEGDKAQTPTRRGFLNWLQLDTLSEIPAAKFDLCAKMLQRKIAKKAAIADGRKGMV